MYINLLIESHGHGNFEGVIYHPMPVFQGFWKTYNYFDKDI